MKRNIIIIFLIAFLVRATVVLIMERHIHPSTWEYDTIAKNILQGKGYVIEYLGTTYRSFGYPVFPYFSAFFLHLGKGSYLLLVAVQVFISAIICVLVYLLCKRIVGTGPVAFLTGLLVALHPGMLIYTTKMHELILTAFLITLVVYLCSLVYKFNIWLILAIGLFIGLGMLTRPTVGAILPGLVFYFYLRFGNLRKTIYGSLLVLLVAGIVITPWIIRNYVVHKRPIFITTNFHEHFWRGNNPNASGSALASDGEPVLHKAPRSFLNRLYEMDELEQYDFFIQTSFRFIKDNPFSFVSLTLKKFLYFWWFSPQSGIRYNRYWLISYKLYYSFILALGVLGFYNFIRFPTGRDIPVIFLVVSLCLIIALIHSFLYVEGRHRWIIEPLLLIFSAQGLYSFSELCLKGSKYKLICLNSKDT